MNVYICVVLVWIIIFPSLFSWALPFICFGFATSLIAHPYKRYGGMNIPLILGFVCFVILGSCLIFINIILFDDYHQWTYWIAGYIVWFLIITLFRSVGDPAPLVHNSIFISGIIVGFGNLFFIISFLLGVITEPISFPGYQAYFGIDYRGFFAYSTSHVPQIGYIVPYFAYKAAKSPSGLSRMETLMMFLVVLTGILSLRSIIWLIIFISFCYYCYATKRKKFFIYTFLIFVFSVGFVLLKLGIGYEAAVAIYDLKWINIINGEDVRYKQIIFWLNSFIQEPFIGHGLSSTEIVIYDLVTGLLSEYRPGTIVSPYGYEFLYGKLLSEIGIFFFFYVAIYAYLTFFSHSHSSLQWQVRALRLSALCMIMQSGTNSYLQTSGWLFTLMLPMIFISSRSTSQ